LTIFQVFVSISSQSIKLSLISNQKQPAFQTIAQPIVPGSHIQAENTGFLYSFLKLKEKREIDSQE